MMNPEEAYKYDATFHRVVDLMRAHLSVYEITPSELRQAAILAATMHEAQRVKPHVFLADSSHNQPFKDERIPRVKDLKMFLKIILSEVF